MAPVEQTNAAEDAFWLQLGEVLRSTEFQTACIQKFVAATLEPVDAERVMELALDRVVEETRGRVANLASRLLRAVDAACAQYAEIRCLPYKKLVGPLSKGWQALMSAASRVGLTEADTHKVMRDMLRKIPASHWSRVKDVERELLAELKFGFTMLALAKGNLKELKHAGSRGRGD